MVVLAQALVIVWLLTSDRTAIEPDSEPTSVPSPLSTGSPATGTAGVSVEDIRRIIREELARGGYERSTAARDPAYESPADPALRDNIVRTIDAGVASGYITLAEIDSLQSQLMGLPAAERNALLSRLAQAINTGQLRIDSN